MVVHFVPESVCKAKNRNPAMLIYKIHKPT